MTDDTAPTDDLTPPRHEMDEAAAASSPAPAGGRDPAPDEMARAPGAAAPVERAAAIPAHAPASAPSPSGEAAPRVPPEHTYTPPSPLPPPPLAPVTAAAGDGLGVPPVPGAGGAPAAAPTKAEMAVRYLTDPEQIRVDDANAPEVEIMSFRPSVYARLDSYLLYGLLTAASFGAYLNVPDRKVPTGWSVLFVAVMVVFAYSFVLMGVDYLGRRLANRSARRFKLLPYLFGIAIVFAFGMTYWQTHRDEILTHAREVNEKSQGMMDAINTLFDAKSLDLVYLGCAAASGFFLVLSLLKQLFDHNHFSYTITTKKVEICTGLILRNYNRLSMTSIYDADLSHSLMDRFFNVGCITLSTSDAGTMVSGAPKVESGGRTLALVELRGVPNVRKVCNFLRTLMSKYEHMGYRRMG